jgi:1-acyl-sn-glycerol-3-phosphate acyltransferase
MGFVARIVKWALVAFFRRQGWTVEGVAPPLRKFVIIAAPHTSNWDFVYFLGAADALNVDLSFMGKASLFRWPFDKMMRDLGGVPVDRSKSGDTVQAMVNAFAARDEFMLTIAPEGTRGKARQWKTGFYNIALKAGVPLVLGFIDYDRKIIGLGPTMTPSGDYEADLARLIDFYRPYAGKHQDRATDL